MTPSRRKLHSVAVEVTGFCNQRCDYCYNAWRGDGTPASDASKQLQRLDRLLETFAIDHVTLTGGEPLSHKHIFAFFDRLHAKGVGIQMISNGTLVTDAIAARLAQYRMRFIQITLNGPNEELHAAHVGRGHFEATLEGIARLRAHGVPVVGCVVVTSKNAPFLQEILALWQSLGVNHVALSRFSPAGYAARHAGALLPTLAGLRQAFSGAAAFARQTAGMNLSCTMPLPPCVLDPADFAPIRFGNCPIGTELQEFALGPAGELRHCTLHGEPLAGVADILDPHVDLQSVVAGSEVHTYRSRRPAFCRGCVHEDTCGGGCGAAAGWVTGLPHEHPDPLVFQYVDDAFAKKLAHQRRDGKTHLELIL